VDAEQPATEHLAIQSLPMKAAIASKHLNLLWLGGLLLTSLGAVMGATNPGLADYTTYATDQLTHYAQTKLCSNANQSLPFRLGQNCQSILVRSQPQIERMIAESTYRQNFLVFSLYKTELSVSPLLPSYRFETLAVFQKFYTYQAETR
jgi:hypothetical protein